MHAVLSCLLKCTNYWYLNLEGGKYTAAISGINAINKLQKLKNRAARIVTNSAYDASALSIIRKLGWPTIYELIESETLKMVYKSANYQAPAYLAERFVKLSDSGKR